MNSPPLSSRWQVWPQGPHFLEEDTLVVTSEEFPRSLPSPGRPKCPHHCEHIYLPKCHSQLWGACRDLPWKGHWLFPWHAVLMCKSLNQPGWSWILSLSVLQHCGGQAGLDALHSHSHPFPPTCSGSRSPCCDLKAVWELTGFLARLGLMLHHRDKKSAQDSATDQEDHLCPQTCSFEWGQWWMLLGVTSGLVDTEREALAEVLLAGRSLRGTLTRLVKVLVSFPPLFLTWSFHRPLSFWIVYSERGWEAPRTQASVLNPRQGILPGLDGAPWEERVSRAESTPTVWHNPVKQCPLLGFVLRHFVLSVARDWKTKSCSCIW